MKNRKTEKRPANAPHHSMSLRHAGGDDTRKALQTIRIILFMREKYI